MCASFLTNIWICPQFLFPFLSFLGLQGIKLISKSDFIWQSRVIGAAEFFLGMVTITKISSPGHCCVINLSQLWMSFNRWLCFLPGGACFLWTILWMIFAYESPAAHPRISAKERGYIEHDLQLSKNKKEVRIGLTITLLQNIKPSKSPKSWNNFFHKLPSASVVVTLTILGSLTTEALWLEQCRSCNFKPTSIRSVSFEKKKKIRLFDSNSIQICLLEVGNWLVKFLSWSFVHLDFFPSGVPFSGHYAVLSMCPLFRTPSSPGAMATNPALQSRLGNDPCSGVCRLWIVHLTDVRADVFQRSAWPQRHRCKKREFRVTEIFIFPAAPAAAIFFYTTLLRVKNLAVFKLMWNKKTEKLLSKKIDVIFRIQKEWKWMRLLFYTRATLYLVLVDISIFQRHLFLVLTSKFYSCWFTEWSVQCFALSYTMVVCRCGWVYLRPAIGQKSHIIHMATEVCHRCR